MNWKKFRVVGAIVTMALAGTIGWSVSTGNPLVSIAAIVIGIVLLRFLKNKVTQVVEDERTYAISQKASRTSLQVFALVSASTGVLLIALSRGGLVALEQAGLTLTYGACALLLLYIILYGYYGKRYGD